MTFTKNNTADEFNFMLKHAEAVAQKLWNNKEDEIWDSFQAEEAY